MLHPPPAVYPRKLRHLYAPFLGLADEMREVIGTVAGRFHEGDHCYTIPRFAFLGPRAHHPQLRLGLFSLVHGDEPAGAHALLQLLCALADDPALARGYDIVTYPVCNPTGYEDGTRHNRRGADLNREFWRDSAQPEVAILEAELRAQRFDGIIALHADDTSDGIYGYTRGRVLNEGLLRPALREAERVLPRNREAAIDGFAAADGMIRDCFEGVLTPPPDRQPRPFELIIETPSLVPVALQADAACAALLAVLAEHPRFLSYAADI